MSTLHQLVHKSGALLATNAALTHVCGRASLGGGFEELFPHFLVHLVFAHFHPLVHGWRLVDGVCNRVSKLLSCDALIDADQEAAAVRIHNVAAGVVVRGASLSRHEVVTGMTGGDQGIPINRFFFVTVVPTERVLWRLQPRYTFHFEVPAVNSKGQKVPR
jgi:hypothetical protein